jgi:long-chain fatty acid transport protein
MSILLPGSALATNGDILIGVGTERGMGGAGIANMAQDAAGGIRLNPASIAGLEKNRVDAIGTIFIPSVQARADLGAGATSDASHANYFIVPAFGFAIPINDRIAVGFSGYGISGMGVDYLNKNVGNTAAFAGMPAPYSNFVGALDFKTTKQLFQFAPAAAFEIVKDRFSIGVSPMVNYGTLDLGQGMQQTIGFGGKVGLRWQILDWIAVGAVYKSPSRMKYSRVFDFDGDGTMDDLRLDQPQEVGWGVSLRPIEGLLICADGKWINWGAADGYDDFRWEDQYVAAFGVQYAVLKWLTVRGGYNYGPSPVRNDSGFASGTSIGTGPDDLRMQGKLMNGGEAGVFAYEAFRTIGFPAIVEHHLTVGATFHIKERYGVSVAYMHAFEASLDETGTLDGQPVSIGSSLAEDTVTLGFHFEF